MDKPLNSFGVSETLDYNPYSSPNQDDPTLEDFLEECPELALKVTEYFQESYNGAS